LSAALGIESLLKNYLRRKLNQQLEHKTKPNVVPQFVKEVSNKFLVKAVLPQLVSLDQSSLDDCWKALDLKNNIVHNEQGSVHKDQAVASIRSLETLMSVDEITCTMKTHKAPSAMEGENNEKS